MSVVMSSIHNLNVNVICCDMAQAIYFAFATGNVFRNMLVSVEYGDNRIIVVKEQRKIWQITKRGLIHTIAMISVHI